MVRFHSSFTIKAYVAETPPNIAVLCVGISRDKCQALNLRGTIRPWESRVPTCFKVLPGIIELTIPLGER